MENIFTICKQLNSLNKVKKQLLLNKPFKLYVDKTELGSYIFRASGDVYISIEGDVNSGFYDFNEESKKIQVEYQKQIFVYDILFMNEKIIITNSSQGVLSIFNSDNSINDIELYLNSLLSSNDSKQNEESLKEIENHENIEKKEKNTSSNSKFIFGGLALVVIIGAVLFFLNKNKNKVEISDTDIQYKQTIIKMFENINLKKDDSVFNLYADTINYFGKEGTLKSMAVIDFRNLTTNTTQDLKLNPDTLSIVVSINSIDSSIVVTGIVIQNSTLTKNLIPYIYRSNFEYRFNKQGKINFINSTVTQKEVDYSVILGVQEGNLIFNNEIEATDFINRNIGRLYDENFDIDYRKALSEALVNKVGPSKIISDYDQPSISYKFNEFIDSLMAKKIIAKSINKIILANNSISEISFSLERLESTTSDILIPGYYYVNANDEYYVYFYASPNLNDRKQSYFNSKDQVYISAIENGFGYLEFTNSRGQTSKGWILLTDLTVD
jgi:hypothetical protein